LLNSLNVYKFGYWSHVSRLQGVWRSSKVYKTGGRRKMFITRVNEAVDLAGATAHPCTLLSPFSSSFLGVKFL
jgi:hypothetical protein